MFSFWSHVVTQQGRKLFGFVHDDDFIFTGGSMQLGWAGSRLNEKLILKRRAILGLDDGDDKTVTILNRLVTWVCLSGSTSRMSDWDSGECRPVLDRAHFLAGISWTLSFACAEFSTLQTCLLCRL